MSEEKRIKNIVKEKYSEIAKRANPEEDCGCSCGCAPSSVASPAVSEPYDDVNGYVREADLGLGCGVPTKFADIKPGDTVVDLGSGAGNDAFVARAIVGSRGRVIGIDMTQDMIDRANINKMKLGFDNVEFHLADIEDLPFAENSVDVVLSNCVLNLVPSKKKAYSEIYRVLKPGAHFCVSDITLDGELPEGLKKSAEMYAGCVAGALKQDEYLDVITSAGFSGVEVKTSKEIYLSDDILKELLTADEIMAYREGGTGILSITVTGYKN
jgi:ubiquinone/menaquinone biosynthesis C-methylase UbiE